MDNFSEPPTQVEVERGQVVTVHLNERAESGMLWTAPAIDKAGLKLEHSRVINEGGKTANQQREFVFRALRLGQYHVTSVLRQAGFEFGVRTFELVVSVKAPESKEPGA
tara:strand:+ start:43 stop:369 length:327 start_codon:yes stop_codon:yes gene_type:complete